MFIKNCIDFSCFVKSADYMGTWVRSRCSKSYYILDDKRQYRECAVCTAVERAKSSSNRPTYSWRFLPMPFLMHQRSKMPVYSYRLRFSHKNSSNGTKHSDRFLLPKPTLTYSSAKSYIVADRNRTSFCCTRASQNPEAPPVPTRRSQPFNRTNPMVLARGGCHSNTSL